MTGTSSGGCAARAGPHQEPNSERSAQSRDLAVTAASQEAPDAQATAVSRLRVRVACGRPNVFYSVFVSYRSGQNVTDQCAAETAPREARAQRAGT